MPKLCFFGAVCVILCSTSGASEFVISDDELAFSEGRPPCVGEEIEMAAPEIPIECKHCPCVDRRKGWPRKPWIKRPGDRNRKDCPPRRYCVDDWCRAGKPHEITKFSQVSPTWRYSGGYVGGGAAICGRGRKCSEGIWGLDYQFTKHTKVFLNWTCGLYQGGEGAYQTDEEGTVELLLGEKTECEGYCE